MKIKLLSVLSVLCLLFTVASCGKKPTDIDVESSNVSDIQLDIESDDSQLDEIPESGSEADSDTSAADSANSTNSTNSTGSKSSTNSTSSTGTASNNSQGGSQPTYAFGTYQERLQAFHNPMGRLMSCAHRADWKNNPENSLEAVKSAIAMGVDAVEIDVMRTKDGVIVLMHDATLTRTTDASAKRPDGLLSWEVKDWTWAQIQTLNLKKGRGGATAEVTSYKVPTLESVIEACRGKVLLNIDQGWNYRSDVYDMLVRMNALEYCWIKSATAAPEVNRFLDSKNPRPLFGAMVFNNVDEAIKQTRAYTTSKSPLPPIVEMAFSNTLRALETNMLSTALINEIKPKMGIMANTLSLSDLVPESEIDTLEYWKRLKDAGYNMIQTDDPAGLVAYINSLYK